MGKRARAASAVSRGATKVIVADPVPRIILDPALCKKCGICVAVCPSDVYRSGRDGLPLIVDRDRCIWCDRCETYCPDYAIRLEGQRGW